MDNKELFRIGEVDCECPLYQKTTATQFSSGFFEFVVKQ